MRRGLFVPPAPGTSSKLKVEKVKTINPVKNFIDRRGVVIISNGLTSIWLIQMVSGCCRLNIKNQKTRLLP